MLLFQAGDDSHAIRIVFYILHVPIDICAYWREIHVQILRSAIPCLRINESVG